MHNYQKVLEKAIAAGNLPIQPGAVIVLEVQHDSWCQIHRRDGSCNCSPDIIQTIRPDSSRPTSKPQEIKPLEPGKASRKRHSPSNILRSNN